MLEIMVRLHKGNVPVRYNDSCQGSVEKRRGILGQPWVSAGASPRAYTESDRALEKAKG